MNLNEDGTLAHDNFSENSQLLKLVSKQMNRHRSSSMVLSIMTGPFLAGLIGARAIAESLTQLGFASEELFRGERLPTLQTIPGASALQSDSSES